MNSRPPYPQSRMPSLGKLVAQPMTDEPSRTLTFRQKLDRWMINEGGRQIFVGVFVLLHIMVYAFGFMNYSMKDNLTQARAAFGITYPIARAAALTLHVDVALIFFPVCRGLISLLRQTPLNSIIDFDKNITLHKLIAWSILFFSWVHTIAHWVNFARLAKATHTGFKGFVLINFRTGPGATGYVMLIALMAIAFTALEKPRRKNYERFWYTHHLFFIFLFAWSFHGAFCMIKPDNPPFCSGIGVFWKYWLVGGMIYLVERLVREVRGTHKTYISKVIQHPSKVCEIQIRKENFKPKAGQYIFLCCPEISLWQYHPFTLTSAPEEDYISVHIRCVGDFTTTLAKKLGCDFSKEQKKAKLDERVSKVVGLDRKDNTEYDHAVDRVLPRVMIDGPFGTASEDFQKYEVVILVGAGIGVTPFASILKSIWYRVNYPTDKKTKLRKVHFFWICRDFESFEWFRSLLAAIESQDIGDLIEIHTYVTQSVKEADAINIIVNDAGADVDAITGLKAPTNFGRPNWDRVFKAMRHLYPATDVGVFFCGPKPLGHTLHAKCNEWSQPGKDGTRFTFGKENF